MRSNMHARHRARRGQVMKRAAVLATAAATTVAVMGGIAFADNTSPDGDTASPGNAIVYQDPAGAQEPCSARGTNVAGRIDVSYVGGGPSPHFTAGETVTVSLTPSVAGISASYTPTNVPSPWASGGTFSIPISTNTATTVATGVYSVGVHLAGAHGYSPVDKSYSVTVDASCTPVVTNHAPVAATLPVNASGDEGSALSASGSFTDPDNDALTITELSGADAVTDNGDGTWSWAYTPADNGTGTVVVQASDGSLTATETFDWTAVNVAPTVGALIVGGSGTACIGGNSVTLDFGFTDPGVNDNDWAVDIDWGDGGTHTTYNATAQGAQTQQSHSYGAGSYTISVTVTDKDGDASAASTGSVSLLYTLSGILAPFNIDGTSVWKYGSTLPVKVRILDCNGSLVSGLAPKVGTSLVSSSDPTLSIDETASTSAADTTGVMRYDATAGQYIYNFASKFLSDPSAIYYMTVKGTDSSGNIVTTAGMVQVKFGLRSK